jgi:translation initiation factor 1
MSRPKESQKKVDVARPAAPLQHNPFAVLGELDALKNLPKPEPEKPAPKLDPIKGDGSFGSAQDRLRPPLQTAKAPKPAIPKNSRGRLVLRREKKDRGGKTVVVISGFAELPGANAVMIADLAKELKGKLGCGGSFDRHEIVLQGDRAAAVNALLEELGFRVDGVKS